MRIYGNRRIETLPGLATRPTASRVRSSVFDIWQARISDCRWLDLCAGSGSMGAEALCRGAALAVGIEQSGRACRIVRRNWQQVADDSRFRLLRGDIRLVLPTLCGEQFDCIYFDPPYNSDLYAKVLKTATDIGVLDPEGELAAEYDPKRWTPIAVKGLELCRQKTYGNTAIAFYCRDDTCVEV
ncbi:RNA methyltransferase, RsmD family [Rubidibacter lacunae KORDI 51-2]|uniref:RNA methyltransferase, RsmD family n=1 Tax=Rubidibacter lacunae KORDI 51-2 TaxID=582515 RepID=U5D7X7_9CHRO|nr:16S rRNA (guanine(966)-N(2))-methyltransferase RsmD [Rubidibacter lacunae]ERN40723.1 RNA methyltransferase, RsmD family [Rubidibacter lacunae KORDI 51-2]